AIVFAPAPPIREGVEALIADGPSWAYMLPEHVSAYDAMAAADLALACSGTVTSELAVQGTPFIVAYRTGPLTYFLGKNFLFKPRHVTLLNIAADDQTIVPEILQKDLTPEALSAQALDWLADPQSLVEQSARQSNALKRMRREGPRAVEVAADAILSVLQTSKP
ncbi:MAG: lipid-A-disaccharide synthase, partial [Pseudomonadota bacterium]